jgi:hypothetical protein
MKVGAREAMKHEAGICESLVLDVELVRKKGHHVQLL